MAEQRKRGSDDALATMNDHLARFFQHADVLLREWKSFGDELRASLDSQVRELQGTVADAVSEAGRAAADKLDGQVQAQVAQSVSRSMETAMATAMNAAMAAAMGDSMAGLRRELDELTRLAEHGAARVKSRGERGAGAAKARAGTARAGTRAGARSGVRSGIFLLALTTANVMLAVLLIMNVHRCTGSERPRSSGASETTNVQGIAPGGAAAPADAAPGDGTAGVDGAIGADGAAGEMEAACAALARDHDPDAARAFLAASAQALCGDDTASQVIETLEPRLVGELAAPDKATPGTDKKKDRRDDKGSDKKSERKKPKSSGDGK